MYEKFKLTTRQILLFLIDGLVTSFQPFDRHGMYRKTIDDYFCWRNFDKKRFTDNLYRLKKEGFVKVYLKDNINQVELTNKGKEKVKLYLAQNFKYEYPDEWDKKWRIIIFDIPNKRKNARDILRFRLKSMGCIQIQKSVYVFPFDCKEVIDFIKNLYDISPYTQYIIAESIESEIDIIGKFIDLGILNNKMII